jgi:hypothetical protein
MATNNKSINVNLDEIVDPEITITLEGQKHHIRAVDGVGFDILSKMTNETSVSAFYDVAVRCAESGSLSEQKIRSLSPAKIAAIVKAATQGAENVEQTVEKNSGRPATRKRERSK